MKVLLVEDNESVAGFIRKGLSEAAHVVDHAGNGRDGVRIAGPRAQERNVREAPRRRVAGPRAGGVSASCMTAAARRPASGRDASGHQ